LRIEVFEPWYFCGARPQITDAPTRACAGEDIEIQTPQAASIQRVALVRTGSVTHNFNPDQRYVSVPFKPSGRPNVLRASLPRNNAVLVPGYYLLFVLDDERRPSLGRFIQICRARRRPRVIDIDLDRFAGLRELLRRALDGRIDLDDLVDQLLAERPKPPRVNRIERPFVDPHMRRHPHRHDHEHPPHDHGPGGGGHDHDGGDDAHG
jgi:hypothetical protein